MVLFFIPKWSLLQSRPWTLTEPGCASPLFSTSSRGKQGRAGWRGGQAATSLWPPEKRSSEHQQLCRLCSYPHGRWASGGCALVCPVYTFMPLFLFYCWDLIPVELLLTKKLKELAQFQVGFLGAGSKNPEELTIHLVFLCWMLNGIPVVPRMAWCSRYLVNSQRTSQFAF